MKKNHSLSSLFRTSEQEIISFLIENGITGLENNFKGSKDIIDISYSIPIISVKDSAETFLEKINNNLLEFKINIIVKEFEENKADKKYRFKIKVSEFDALQKMVFSANTKQSIFFICIKTGVLFSLKNLLENKSYFFSSKNVVFEADSHQIINELPLQAFDLLTNSFGKFFKEHYEFKSYVNLDPLKLRLKINNSKFYLSKEMSKIVSSFKQKRSNKLLRSLQTDFLLAEFVLFFHLTKGGFNQTIKKYLRLKKSLVKNGRSVTDDEIIVFLNKVIGSAKEEIVDFSHKKEEIFNLLSILSQISEKISFHIEEGKFNLSNSSSISQNIDFSNYLDILKSFSKEDVYEIIQNAVSILTIREKIIIEKEIDRHLFLLEIDNQSNSKKNIKKPRDLLIGMGSSFNYFYCLEERGVKIEKIYVFKETFRSKICNHLFGFKPIVIKSINEFNVWKKSKQPFVIFDFNKVNLEGKLSDKLYDFLIHFNFNDILFKFYRTPYLNSLFFNSNVIFNSKIINYIKKYFKNNSVLEILFYSKIPFRSCSNLSLLIGNDISNTVNKKSNNKLIKVLDWSLIRKSVGLRNSVELKFDDIQFSLFGFYTNLYVEKFHVPNDFFQLNELIDFNRDMLFGYPASNLKSKHSPLPFSKFPSKEKTSSLIKLWAESFKKSIFSLSHDFFSDRFLEKERYSNIPADSYAFEKGKYLILDFSHIESNGDLLIRDYIADTPFYINRTIKFLIIPLLEDSIYTIIQIKHIFNHILGDLAKIDFPIKKIGNFGEKNGAVKWYPNSYKNILYEIGLLIFDRTEAGFMESNLNFNLNASDQILVEKKSNPELVQNILNSKNRISSYSYSGGDFSLKLDEVIHDEKIKNKILTLFESELNNYFEDFSSGFHNLKERFRLSIRRFKTILELIEKDRFKEKYNFDYNNQLNELDNLYIIFDNVVKEYLLKFKNKQWFNVIDFWNEISQLIQYYESENPLINFTYDFDINPHDPNFDFTYSTEESSEEISHVAIWEDFYLKCSNDLINSTIGELVQNSIKYAWYNSDIKEKHILISVSCGSNISSNEKGEPIPSDSYLEIIFKDNGGGILNKDDLFSMGERFEMQKTDIPGSGFGLYTMKSMIENANGSIGYVKGSDIDFNLDSDYCFHIKLPIVALNDEIKNDN